MCSLAICCHATYSVSHDRRPCALAIRDHDDHPLDVRHGDARHGHCRRIPADPGEPDSKPGQTGATVQNDSLLGADVCHQLRDGHSLRNHPRIPIRHELERTHPLRRQRVRGSPGSRDPRRVRRRVHVPGPVDIRLGQAAAMGPHHADLARGGLRLRLGFLGAPRQRLHARTRRVRHWLRRCGAPRQRRGVAAQRQRLVGVPPRHRRGARGRRRHHRDRQRGASV